MGQKAGPRPSHRHLPPIVPQDTKKLGGAPGPLCVGKQEGSVEIAGKPDPILHSSPPPPVQFTSCLFYIWGSTEILVYKTGCYCFYIFKKERNQTSSFSPWPFDPAIPLLGPYLEKKPNTNLNKYMQCTPMFIVALFTLAKIWKQLKGPATDE